MAARLTFGIESAVGNATWDSPILTDQQMSRFLDYVWDTYPQLNLDGSRKTRNAINLAAAFNEWAEALWHRTTANVFEYERRKVALAAEDGVAEFPSLLPTMFKSLKGTGSIEAGSNVLTLVSNPGFEVGDKIIVEIGAEAGQGLRGTKGVGGTWPAKSYPDLAAMEADETQEENLFAWREDTGDIYQWVAGAWTPSTQLYYAKKAVPRSLVATIEAIDGNTLTLDKEAVEAATNANVHYDNAPIFNALGDFHAPDPPLRTIDIPAGEFAIANRLQVHDHTEWTIKGQGRDNTTVFSPKGVPSAHLSIYQCTNCVVRDFHLKGNVGGHGFGFQYGLAVTETAFPQGGSYPKGVDFGLCNGGVASDVLVTDVFQMSVGASFSTDVWAYRCEARHTSGLRQYIQWDFNWADCTGGGTVDCVDDSPKLIPAFEAFRSVGVSHIRPQLRNGVISFNSCGNWLLEDATVTIEANSQLNDNFSIHNPIINVNSNIQPPNESISEGGKITDPTIVQEGPINADGDVLAAIIINRYNPNVHVLGGYIEHPPADLGTATGVSSTGDDTLVDGLTVVGSNANEAWGNIWVASGKVVNCTAEKIIAP